MLKTCFLSWFSKESGFQEVSVSILSFTHFLLNFKNKYEHFKNDKLKKVECQPTVVSTNV